jgi:hypothetical protein
LFGQDVAPLSVVGDYNREGVVLEQLPVLIPAHLYELNREPLVMEELPRTMRMVSDKNHGYTHLRAELPPELTEYRRGWLTRREFVRIKHPRDGNPLPTSWTGNLERGRITVGGSGSHVDQHKCADANQRQ